MFNSVIESKGCWIPLLISPWIIAAVAGTSPLTAYCAAKKLGLISLTVVQYL